MRVVAAVMVGIGVALILYALVAIVPLFGAGPG